MINTYRTPRRGGERREGRVVGRARRGNRSGTRWKREKKSGRTLRKKSTKGSSSRHRRKCSVREEERLIPSAQRAITHRFKRHSCVSTVLFGTCHWWSLIRCGFVIMMFLRFLLERLSLSSTPTGVGHFPIALFLSLLLQEE